MPDAAGILKVVERLYSAAANPAEWTPALESVVGLLRSGHARMQLGLDPTAGFAVHACLDKRDEARLSSPEALRLSAQAFAAAPIGTAFSSSALWADRDFERSEFYNEFIRPVNGFYGAGAMRVLPLGLLYIGVCRPRTAGDFASSELAVLQVLLPHLAIAVELHHRLRAATDGYANLLDLIDRLDTGVILADAAGTPVFVNARALRIATEMDGLSLNGALTGASPEATRRLREAIAQVAADGACEPLRIALDRPSRRPPLLLSLLPGSRLGTVVPGVGTPRVAIFITTPDEPGAISREAVADTFQLTRREAEVAVLLAEGRDVAGIASELGVRVVAVRQYLKRVFDKTGTHGQAALVALLRGFTSPCH